MKILWLTDTHLNIATEHTIDTLCAHINRLNADMVMISGDITDGPLLEQHLIMLAKQIEAEIYFVLGNHDFYHSSIEQMRSAAVKLSDLNPKLHYLTDKKLIKLNRSTCLIGHDGWADGRCGDFVNSPVVLNDYRLIAELSGLNQPRLLKKLNQLGDEATAYVRDMLLKAFGSYRHVILLTHVPPFKHASWHEGNCSDEQYGPHFASKAMGDMLMTLMTEHSDKILNVYCGHTHGEGCCYMLPNLQVMTGGAEYCHPKIQAPIYLPD